VGVPIPEVLAELPERGLRSRQYQYFRDVPKSWLLQLFSKVPKCGPEELSILLDCGQNLRGLVLVGHEQFFSFFLGAERHEPSDEVPTAATIKRHGKYPMREKAAKGEMLSESIETTCSVLSQYRETAFCSDVFR
jgi:hypothetical protein